MPKSTKRNPVKRERHHLDRRAANIDASPIADGPPDQLLRTKEVASWLGTHGVSLP